MKEKFIKSTLILLVGGCITKILGMIIKMVMGRLLGSEGLGLYMLILPTFSLFIGIGQAGLPIALSKLIAEETRNNKRLFFSVVPVSLIINILLIILIIILAPYLAYELLDNSSTYYGILAIALVIPFISISSICRSYFFGKGKMVPHIVSNIVEDLVRLMVMIIGIPFFIDKGLPYLLCFLILSNVVSESVSILILLLFLPKNFILKRSDFIPRVDYIKESLSIGIPNTCGRLVGSIGYFLEPILLISTLTKVGYSSSFITNQYGILSGYVMPILLLPSFFTSAISQALLPVLSKDYASGNIGSVKRKLGQGIFISLAIGFCFMGIFVLFPDVFLKIIYHTNEGVSYMRFLAPVCLFQYLQAPLSVCLDAFGKSRQAMIGSFLGMITRILLLVFFSYFKIGLWGLIFAISINVFIITIYDFLQVRKALV